MSVYSKCIFVFYDDGIFMSPDKILIDKDLIASGLKIEDQGYPSNSAGMNINQNDDRSMKLLQPALIKFIIKLSFPKPVPGPFNINLASCFRIMGQQIPLQLSHR